MRIGKQEPKQQKSAMEVLAEPLEQPPMRTKLTPETLNDAFQSHIADPQFRSSVVKYMCRLLDVLNPVGLRYRRIRDVRGILLMPFLPTRHPDPPKVHTVSEPFLRRISLNFVRGFPNFV